VFRRRPGPTAPTLTAVVPVYAVEEYLPACLASIAAQTYDDYEVIVVDDGSPDRSGKIAERHARKDRRIRVLHQQNAGLGAARNAGVRAAKGELLTFVDSDDELPPDAWSRMVETLRTTGSDLVIGKAVRDNGRRRWAMPRMKANHAVERLSVTVEEMPGILADVFAWNKVFRRSFWDSAGLSWPEGVRYEDQPTTTAAFLRARRLAVTAYVVYHWRLRTDGSSITQGRARVDDLRDRWTTKQLTLDAVRREGTADLERALLDRVLPADLWRYFELIPDADDAWWSMLVEGVRDLWGPRSLTHSVLPPVHRLTGWLVEQGRREDAVLVITHLRSLAGQRVARVSDAAGTRIDIPGIDVSTIAPEALAVRPSET